jgi:DNA-binding SARP family transcriptional activator
VTTSDTALLEKPRTVEPAGVGPESWRASRADVEVRLLGDFAVRLNGRDVPSDRWSRRHSATLVKLLALAPGRSLHREQVLDALWPDLDIEAAAPRLHKAAHYARNALGSRDAVVLGDDVVRLLPHQSVDIDAARFQDVALSALRDGSRAAAKAALTMYSGDLLPHDPYESWTEPQRHHLTDLYTSLLHQAEDWHLALSIDPADETAHLALAQRYVTQGDRVSALRQLDRLDDAVNRDLGLVPSTCAVALRQQLLTRTAASAADDDARCCAATSEHSR